MYPNPEEECNLKRILEQNEMDQDQNDAGFFKPKVFVRRLHSRSCSLVRLLLSRLLLLLLRFLVFRFLGCVFLSQTGDYMFQLGAHEKQKLKVSPAKTM